MCGRFTLIGNPEDKESWRLKFQEVFGTGEPEERCKALTSNRYNVASTQEIAIIKDCDEGRVNLLTTAMWGIVFTGRPIINASRSSLLSKWSHLMHRNRVLVPADGWYQWSKPKNPRKGKAKWWQPWHFTVDGGQPFAFAALHRQGQIAIVTTAPCPTVDRVEARMPALIADVPQMKAWLDMSVSGEEAAELIGPFDDSRIHVRKVSRHVSNWQYDEPGLLDPAWNPEK